MPAFEPPPVKLLPPVGEAGSAKLPVKDAVKLPRKFAELPPKALPPHSSDVGWEALVRPTPIPGMPKTPTAGQTAPSLAPGLATTRPGTPFRRILGKLRERRPPHPTLRAKAPKTAERSTAEKTPTPPVPRRLGGRRIGELLPPVGTFKTHEVLAINLTAAGLAKARAGGFDVTGQTELSGLGITLTRLVPPASLNAVSARERLFDLVPDGGFALNRVYAPYRLGAGPQSGGDSRPMQQGGGGCPSERCFGSALIKWQPALAACARDLKVGVIDTGFDKAHPALAGVRYRYKEFLPDGSVKASPHHGTGVLALLAGKADSGTPGLIPDASFVFASAFFDDADGQPMSDTAQMVRALDWLKRSGVKVVNLSFAGPEDDLVHHAVRELTKSGVVVVAAAGNDGPGAPPSYPAAYAEVIAVTAVDRKLAAYRYAGRGAHIDLAAPGVDVWTAIPGRREGPQTGTSFAVPYVTAVIAVALSESELAPDGDALAPKRRVLAKLQGSVRSLGADGRDPTFGEGLVQAPTSCHAPAPVVVTASLTGPASEPWAATVKRVVDTTDAEVHGKGGWITTVRAVSGGGAGR
jgi:subtilisin family serine protease